MTPPDFLHDNRRLNNSCLTERNVIHRTRDPTIRPGWSTLVLQIDHETFTGTDQTIPTVLNLPDSTEQGRPTVTL